MDPVQETESIVKRYAAVTAEQDEWGICCVLGLAADSKSLLRHSVEPVQCALQLLSSLTQASCELGRMPDQRTDTRATAPAAGPHRSSQSKAGCHDQDVVGLCLPASRQVCWTVIAVHPPAFTACSCAADEASEWGMGARQSWPPPG